MEAAAPQGLVGRQLGEFFLVNKIGEGGFGAVYRASQPALDREAVVKILHARLRDDHDAVMRFMREARLAARLDHPYAAHVYAYGAEPDGILWIAMELVRGTPLSEVLRAQGPIPLGRLVPFIEQLCDVVHSAHEKGIIHRDIKPANVMVLSRGGRLLPKLLDLGVAKLIDDVLAGAPARPRPPPARRNVEATLGGGDAEASGETLPPPGHMTEELPSEDVSLDVSTSGASAVVGSPLYMAPEVWRGMAADTRGDVYALGVLLFECLTGAPPFRAARVEELAQAHFHQPVPALPAHLPAALGPVVERALAKEREGRYATPLELAAALREAAEPSAAVEILPRLAEDVSRTWRQDGPRPVAEALVLLEACRNVHQAREALAVVVSTLAQLLGVIALACHTRRRKAVKVFDELRRGRLDDEGWLALTARLCSPYADKPDAHPMPELVAAFAIDTEPPLVELVRELAATRGQVATGAVDAALRRLLPRLAAELERLAFLSLYPLVVGRSDTAEVWRGPRQLGADPPLRCQHVEPGRAALVDAGGELVASLWPFAQVASPAPGLPEALFLLAGRGRGGAVLVATPHGFELPDETLFASEDEEVTGAEQAPYRGLAAFTAADAERFFGREREVVEVVNRLRVQPLLVVIGPSGSGKSSFVQAGVLGALPPGWRALVLRPGPTPLATLAARAGVSVADLEADPGALGRMIHGPTKPDGRGASSRRSDEGVGRWPITEERRTDAPQIGRQAPEAHELSGLGRALPATTVLVIDQLEELFTLCDDAVERDRFARALAAAAGDTVRVVATLRDDFLVRLESLAGWRERTASSLHILGTPAPDDLLRIIVEPARRAGYDLAPGLAQDMVAQVAGQPSALCLLSFTAARLWDQRDRHTRQLTRAAYDEQGGVGGALAHHAEEVLAAMPVDERRLTREAFRQLVTALGTRAVLSRKDLVALLGSPRADAVLDRLVEARLLAAAQAESGEDRVEVIHEALLTAWPRLVTWRQEDAAGVVLHEQLRAAARQWDQRGRATSFLWRDEAEAELRLWRRRGVRLTELEEAFATASLREATRGRRVRLGGLAAAFVVLVIVVGVLLMLTSRAQRERREAERARHAEAESAAQAQRTVAWQYEAQGRAALLGGDPLGALVYLAEAWRRGDDTRVLRLMLRKAAQPLDRQLAVLSEHARTVRSVAISPAGDRMVTASTDGDVRVRDAATGAVLLRLAAAEAEYIGVGFSPDGSVIATHSRRGPAQLWDARDGHPRARLGTGKVSFAPGGELALTWGGPDGLARVWRVTSGTEVATLRGHRGPINFATATRDGRVVTGSEDGTMRVWSLATGKPLATIACGSAILSGSAAPDGSVAALGLADGRFQVRALDGRLLGDQRAHDRGVYWLELSPDGKELVTAGYDDSARLWDTATARFLRLLRAGDGEVSVARFAPDGQHVVSFGSGPVIWVFDSDTGRLVSRLVGHTDGVFSVAFTPDGSRLLSGGNDETARLFALGEDDVLTTFEGHTATLYVARFLPGGRVLTSAEDSTVRVWDGATGRLLTTHASYRPKGRDVIDQGDDARAVAVSPDGELVASADEADVRVWRLADDRTVATLGGHEGRVWSVAFSPDGTQLATGDDHQARIWDLASGRQLRELTGHGDRLRGVAFDPGGRWLASSSDDGTVRLWPLAPKGADDGLARVLRGHGAGVTSVTFNHDGTRLLSTSIDRSVRVWDTATGGELRSLVGHGDSVRAAAFSPTGDWIASAGDDYTVRVWDGATGDEAYTFTTHTGAVQDVVFDASGGRLLSASEDYTARIVVLEQDGDRGARSPADLAELARCRVPLTVDEGRLQRRAKPSDCP